MIRTAIAFFFRCRKKQRRWLSQRIYDSEPILGMLFREAKRVEKERCTPGPAGKGAVRATRFLPSLRLYALSVVIAAVFVCALLFLGTSEAGALLNATIPIQWTVTIVALAVPVVSTYTGIRSGDELAISYLWHVTRIARFAECAGAAVVLNMFAWMMGLGFANASAVGWGVLVIARILALGLTIGTVLALVGVLLEVILVASRPDFAIRAGARFHTLGLMEGMLRQCYINIFLSAHRAELDKAVAHTHGLRGPSHQFDLYVRSKKPNGFLRPWTVKGTADLSSQFVDYNLRTLQKLGERLPHGVTVYLHRHGPWLVKPGALLELGEIASDLPSEAARIPRARRLARVRPDRCLQWSEEERDAWADLYRRSVNVALSRYDQTSFAVLVRTLRECWERLGAIAPEPLKDNLLLWRFGRFYVQLLEQVLRCAPPAGVPRCNQIFDFVSILQHEFRKGLDDCVRAGEMTTFSLHVEQLADLYELLCRWCERNIEEPGVGAVNDKRAMWGMNLRMFDSFAGDLRPSALPQEKGAFLYAIHRNCLDWARKAIRRKDFDCAVILGAVLADVYKVAQSWDGDLASGEVNGIKYSAVMWLRHLALLGEVVEEGNALAKPLLKKEIEVSATKARQVLSLASRRDFTSVLDDFGPRWNLAVTSSDPLLGSATHSGFVGSPEAEKLMLGTTLCLAREWQASGGRWRVEPIAVSLKDVEGALRKLGVATKVLADNDIFLFRGWDKELFDWLKRCRAAYDRQDGIRLAKADLNPDLVEEYKATVQREYPKSLLLFGFLMERGLITTCESASTVVVDYPSKDMFLPLDEKGYWEDGAYERDARGWGAMSEQHLLQSVVREARKSTPLSGVLAVRGDKDVPEALKTAAAWLRARSVPPEAGLLVATARLMLVAEAFTHDKAWAASWSTGAAPEGFSGCYDEYPVWGRSYLGESVVVALDLTSCRPLRVMPSVRETGMWCHVEISRHLYPPDKRAVRSLIARTRGRKRHYLISHYCRRRIVFHWDVAATGIQDHSALIVFPGVEEGDSR